MDNCKDCKLTTRIFHRGNAYGRTVFGLCQFHAMHQFYFRFDRMNKERFEVDYLFLQNIRNELQQLCNKDIRTDKINCYAKLIDLIEHHHSISEFYYLVDPSQEDPQFPLDQLNGLYKLIQNVPHMGKLFYHTYESICEDQVLHNIQRHPKASIKAWRKEKEDLFHTTANYETYRNMKMDARMKKEQNCERVPLKKSTRTLFEYGERVYKFLGNTLYMKAFLVVCSLAHDQLQAFLDHILAFRLYPQEQIIIQEGVISRYNTPKVQWINCTLEYVTFLNSTRPSKLNEWEQVFEAIENPPPLTPPRSRKRKMEEVEEEDEIIYTFPPPLPPIPKSPVIHGYPTNRARLIDGKWVTAYT